MTKKDLKIVFMGTPDFAVESLRVLVEGGYTVVGIVTMPDKPAGRHGSILQPSAVKQYADMKGLPVLQPEKLKDEGFLEALRSLQADLQIVVAFRMLPEIVWAMPRFGTINLHASLLPQYRGAAPINWAIINGETETGVTTFFITHGMDNGQIIQQRKWPITETDDAGQLHNALMCLGAKTVLETVDRLTANDGVIETIPQERLLKKESDLYRDTTITIAGCEDAFSGTTTILCAAPKIFKETCRIDWRQPVAYIYNFIRGLSPSPAAWTELINPSGTSMSIKLFAAEKRLEKHNLPPGAIRTDVKDNEASFLQKPTPLDTNCTQDKQFFDVAATDGFIRILSLQLAGKKRMMAKDFLNGTKIDARWRMR